MVPRPRSPFRYIKLCRVSGRPFHPELVDPRSNAAPFPDARIARPHGSPDPRRMTGSARSGPAPRKRRPAPPCTQSGAHPRRTQHASPVRSNRSPCRRALSTRSRTHLRALPGVAHNRRHLPASSDGSRDVGPHGPSFTREAAHRRLNQGTRTRLRRAKTRQVHVTPKRIGGDGGLRRGDIRTSVNRNDPSASATPTGHT